MKILLITMLLLHINFAKGAEKDAGNNLSIRLLTVQGTKPKEYSKALTTLSRIKTLEIETNLQGYIVFAVRQGRDFAHPSGLFGALLIKDGDIPVYFESMQDAAAFLSKRIGKVDSLEKAKELMTLIPEMFSYKIVREPPILDGISEEEIIANILASSTKKLNTEKKPIKGKNKIEWPVRFKTTKNGWSKTCTLLFDPTIKLCKQVTIWVSKDGSIRVSTPKTVFKQGDYL